jgi:hypothetical protein
VCGTSSFAGGLTFSRKHQRPASTPAIPFLSVLAGIGWASAVLPHIDPIALRKREALGDHSDA